MPLNTVGDDECWEHDEDLDEAGGSRVNIVLTFQLLLQEQSVTVVIIVLHSLEYYES